MGINFDICLDRERRKGAAYRLRDDFTAAIAAGSLNGTAADPGPGGNRTVNDTAGTKLRTSGGYLDTNGNLTTGNCDPRITYAGTGIPFTRSTPGQMLCSEWMTVTVGGAGANTGPYVGLFTSATPAFAVLNEGRLTLANTPVMFLNNGTAAVSGTLTTGNTMDTLYKHVLSLRSAGIFWFQEVSGTWLLRGITENGTTATLYPGYCSAGANESPIKMNTFRSPIQRWQPAPLVSDGFAGTADVGSATGKLTDGAGHVDYASFPGGSGLSWTAQVGTVGITGGKLYATALNGDGSVNGTNRAVATITIPTGLSTGDVYVSAKYTAGAVDPYGAGVVARFNTSDDYVFCYYEDKTTNRLINVNRSGGVDAATSLVGASYSAGARITLRAHDTNFRAHYNGAYVTSNQTYAGKAGLKVGVIFFDKESYLDNITVYAVGTEGQYNHLARFFI